MEHWLWRPRLTPTGDSALVSAEEDIEERAAVFDALSEEPGLARSPEEESNTRALPTTGPQILWLISNHEPDGSVVAAPEKKLGGLVLRADGLVEDAVEKNSDCEKTAKLTGGMGYATRPGTDRIGVRMTRPISPLMCRDSLPKLIKIRSAGRQLATTLIEMRR